MPPRPGAFATAIDLMVDNSSSCCISGILKFTSAGTLLTFSVYVSLSKLNLLDAFSVFSLSLNIELLNHILGSVET